MMKQTRNSTGTARSGKSVAMLDQGKDATVVSTRYKLPERKALRR